MQHFQTQDGPPSRFPDDDLVVIADDEIEVGVDVATIAADVAVLQEARRRMRATTSGNDRRSGLITGGSFLIVVAAWNLIAPPAVWSIGTFAACVAVYIVAASVEFEIGPGSALPTTPVQVLMLFLL